MRVLTTGIEGVLFYRRRQTESHILGKAPPTRKSSRQSSATTAKPDRGLAMPKEILLTQSQIAIVDDADFEWLNQWKWCAQQSHMPEEDYTFYVVRHIRSGVKTTKIYMHRLILGLRSTEQGDHINGDGLDNRRCNLRSCSHSQNQMNSRKRRGCSSQFKGVSWDKARHKWQAYIRVNGKKQHFGRHTSELEAARAYDSAARELFGEFARPNLEAANVSIEQD